MRSATASDIHNDLVVEARAGHRGGASGRVDHGHALGETHLHIADEILAERLGLSTVGSCHCIGAARALTRKRSTWCTRAGRSARMQATATERAVRGGDRNVVHEQYPDRSIWREGWIVAAGNVSNIRGAEVTTCVAVEVDGGRRSLRIEIITRDQVVDRERESFTAISGVGQPEQQHAIGVACRNGNRRALARHVGVEYLTDQERCEVGLRGAGHATDHETYVRLVRDRSARSRASGERVHGQQRANRQDCNVELQASHYAVLSLHAVRSMHRKTNHPPDPDSRVRYSESSDQLGCRAAIRVFTSATRIFRVRTRGCAATRSVGLALKTLVIIGIIDLTQRDHIHSDPAAEMTAVTVVRLDQ